MFRPFSGGPQQQAQTPPPSIQSWYPPSVLGPATSGSSRPDPSTSFGSSTSGTNPLSRSPSSATNDARPHTLSASQSQSSLPGVANAHPQLRNKSSTQQIDAYARGFLEDVWKARYNCFILSVEELSRLMTDQDAYNTFLHSLNEVRRMDKLGSELRKGNIDDARNNLAKESQIAELRNQCMIIRNTELAAAREKFEEVQKREKEVNSYCSQAALLNRLQEAANEADEESENLHRKLLAGEIELAEFIQKYRKERVIYHRRTLIRLAAMTSLPTPG